MARVLAFLVLLASVALQSFAQETPEGLVARLRTYNEGDSRADIIALERAMPRWLADATGREALEGAVLALVQSDATIDSKRIACRMLQVAGGPKSVTVLAKLLNDEQLGHMAAYGLSTNLDPGVNPALRESLRTAPIPRQITIIGTLGQRRDAGAVAILVEKARHADRDLAMAALAALGDIGGTAAAESLLALDPADAAVADASLRCGSTLSDKAIAAKLARRIYDQQAIDDSTRAAALQLLARTDAAQASTILVQRLASAKPADIPQLAALVRLVAGPEVTSAAVTALDRLPAEAKPALIDALAQRGDPAALAAIIKASEHADTSVRIAAAAALGHFGGAAVPHLARMAASPNGEERDVALRSLSLLRGDSIDPALLKLIESAEPLMRVGAIRAAVARNTAAAAPLLLKGAVDDDPATRAAAIEALASLGGPEEYAKLLAILLKPRDQGDMPAMEKSLLAVGRRLPPAQAVQPITSALATAADPAKPSLIRTLAVLGTPEALAAVRQIRSTAAGDVQTAAVRALADWPDIAASGDLLAILKDSTSPIHRALALRGALRLARLSTIDLPRRVQFLRDLRAHATSPVEQKMLLAALADVPDPAVLEMAAAYLDNADVRQEALLAVMKLSEALVARDSTAVRAAMTRAAKATTDEALLARIKALAAQSANIAPQGKASSPDGIDKDGAAGGDQAGIDGNLDTYWDEADNKPAYRYVVTFDAPRNIAAISIVGFRHHDFAPRDFVILADGKPVKTVRNAIYTENRLWESLPGVRATTIELNITRAYGPSPAIRELGIYEPLDTQEGKP